jgi:hypothetical protein
MALELPQLAVADKTLTTVGPWVDRDAARRSAILTFSSALEIDGVSIAGLRIRCTALKDIRNASVSFQLEYHRPRQHGSALGRVEWRPIKSHNNFGLGPKEHRYLEIDACHVHPFDVNWAACRPDLRRGNLLAAIPIQIELKNFIAALEFVGKEFRIKGIERIPEPPWNPPGLFDGS